MSTSAMAPRPCLPRSTSWKARSSVAACSAIAIRSSFAFSIRSRPTSPPAKTVHVVLDNYATHKHAKVRAWLDRHPPLCLPLHPDLGLLAQCGRGLLRQIDQATPQTRGLPLDC